MRDFNAAPLQALEIIRSSRIEAARVSQELFVEIFNEPGISTGQRRGR
jgi:hypothetical protein